MSAAALDRQIRPIYDALDTGSNKSAILACNKLLKKYPKSDLLKSLKALALVRSQKVEESLVLCDEVLASKPTDDSTLTAMMHVLRHLGRHSDMVVMFEDAFKRQPGNEELGVQTFFANVRTGNWKTAQLHATKLKKQFGDDRYVYWGIMCAILQANDHITPPNMCDLLYKLAHRLASSVWSATEFNPDRLHLYLSILRKLHLYDDARTVLDSEQGKSICSRSLACDELRREIWKEKGWLKEEGKLAEERIVHKQDRNWLEFLSVLDATFSSLTSSNEAPDASAREECTQEAARVRILFTKVAEEDGRKDRSGLLALLELEKRARIHDVSSDPSRLVDLLQQYHETFGDKAASYEDLKPYLDMDGEDLTRWISYLDGLPHSSSSLADLQRSINVYKLSRYNLQPSQYTVELEVPRALHLKQEYLEALSLGKDLPKTELQPADDLAILAAQVYVGLYSLSGDKDHLQHAIVFLEYASKKSPQSYLIHLHLIRIYRLLGAPQPALEHYRLLNVKQVQNDTLSHYILNRASDFSLAASGDLTYASECLESSQIYLSNTQEVKKGNTQTNPRRANVRQTADFIVRAFNGEKYSQIPDFIAFEDRLDNSLERDLVKMEHVRMRITHETINSDLIDMELIELKFIFERMHHDNRDFALLPNYQPLGQPSFVTQTTLMRKQPGFGWLSVFLKIYIRALQQASDMDNTVEEKLLIGDRPKPSTGPDNNVPLNDRVSIRRPEELAELTSDELTFYNYATDLADWLAPYHDHTRPPPSVVLAEATKQAELKTGHPLKGLEVPVDSGNGHAKKAEDAPLVKEAPASLVTFFTHMQSRFKALLESNSPSPELLHVASITQEALILLNIETLRFKNQSVIKVHKLGPLAQSFKAIRASAVGILGEMSKDLIALGEGEGTSESRKAFVEQCKDLQGDSNITHDYVLDVAKKVTDARKKVLEGFGKGIARVCTNHA
ncbi:TPR-like protein [Artomyces pyxidatus]|uniref:TPR-like protein n=1 Tax=Artomyces pyxidatus TaxID=48021 RepID=A0ACB8TBK9_9AGAM|nr:TPR-like protein [Artomyces pyxidatus]